MLTGSDEEGVIEVVKVTMSSKGRLLDLSMKSVDERMSRRPWARNGRFRAIVECKG